MENEFTPITSQEALDNVLKERLNRQSEKHSRELAEVRGQYADYDELKTKQQDYETQLNELRSQLDDAQAKVSGYDSQIAERDERIKAFEVRELKLRIANDENLDAEAIEFLHGETEDEIRESARHLSAITTKRVAPLAKNESGVTDPGTQAYISMLGNL